MSRQVLSLVFALLAVLSVLCTSVDADAKPKTERGVLTYNIVLKWSGVVQKRYRQDVRHWAAQMIPVFRKAPIAQLRAAAAAQSFEEMNDALIGKPTKSPPVMSRVLGQIEKDYLFAPVPPCRIADTRLAGGPILAGETRNILGTAGDFAGQGGSASNCGLPADPAALMMNVTVVDPLAPGYLTAFVTNQSRPLASSLNYATGQIINNQMIAWMINIQAPARNTTFSLYSFSTTHVVIDVVGYFSEAKLTYAPIDCIGFPSNASIPANSAGTTVFLGCPINYSITSIACNSGYNPDVGVIGSSIVSQGACRIRNNTNTIQGVELTARCCRQIIY